VAALALTMGLAGCAAVPGPPLDRIEASGPATETFTMADGARLPVRTWLPEGKPRAVVLALHGFNDSRDAWELPAPVLSETGLAVFAPDQRGFGAAPGRGRWPGTAVLVGDARTMAVQLRRRYPGVPLYLMGESMGAAVLMVLAASPDAPPVQGYVLLAPAVWGRGEMNVFLRGSLWLAYHLAPGWHLTGNEVPVKVRASDNRAALVRLSLDPLTLHSTRVDTLHGLVDLMDAAQRASALLRGPALALYGGLDDLVPKRATEDAWHALPPGTRIGYYPTGHHLLMRDLGRAVPIGDVLAWMSDPETALPSGADAKAAEFLKEK
jgi:alpha-beta hydrolase superfamily lysophospholipase